MPQGELKVVDEGVVYASRPKTDGCSSVFPVVAVLPTGRWLCGMRLAPAKSSRFGRAFICWSDDAGRTWSEPHEPIAAQKVAGQPGVWRALAVTPLGGRRVLATLAWEQTADPLRPMFNEATEGLVDMKLFVAVSDDAGEHFSRPRRVVCGRYRDVPTPITGPALVMPDGRWAVQFEVNKHYDETEPWQHHSALVFSGNEGRRWSQAVDTHSDPQRRLFCWDQRAALLHDGTVLVLYWTFDRERAVYLPIHARASHDSGRTWGELWNTGVPGQPARPVSLPDGRVVLVYVDRENEPQIKARLSSDGGRTFLDDTELLVHQRHRPTQTWQKGTMQDAWAEMSEFSIGLPDAVAMPTANEGQVLAVYYSGDHPDATDIRWARLAV